MNCCWSITRIVCAKLDENSRAKKDQNPEERMDLYF